MEVTHNGFADGPLAAGAPLHVSFDTGVEWNVEEVLDVEVHTETTR